MAKPGRNGTGMPSPPAVNPRQRLTAMSNTCDSAMVDSAKYGPLRRFDRNPRTSPATIEMATPRSIPSHGPWWNRVTMMAPAYAPIPKNEAWPIDTWPA